MGTKVDIKFTKVTFAGRWKVAHDTSAANNTVIRSLTGTCCWGDGWTRPTTHTCLGRWCAGPAQDDQTGC